MPLDQSLRDEGCGGHDMADAEEDFDRGGDHLKPVQRHRFLLLPGLRWVLEIQARGGTLGAHGEAPS